MLRASKIWLSEPPSGLRKGFSLPEWMSEGACTEVDPEIFFPDRGGSSKAARAVCKRCPVLEECREFAVIEQEKFGIWGDTSEQERRKLRRARGLTGEWRTRAA